MSQQQGPVGDVPTPPPMTTSDSPPAESKQPVSQEKRGFRQGWPAWLKQMPRLKFPPPKEDFQLIDQQQLLDLYKQGNVDAEAAKQVVRDLKHADTELLRLFRDRDYEAKFQQNRYRLYQVAYMSLAALATLLGSLLALFLEVRPAIVPYLALAETFVALGTTYLATISGREPPLPLWLDNRRRAETLRREYFRYMANIEPYDAVEGYEREMLLARRAADINRGFFPGQMPNEGT